jgi:hypothetical protein
MQHHDTSYSNSGDVSYNTPPVKQNSSGVARSAPPVLTYQWRHLLVSRHQYSQKYFLTETENHN